MLSSGRLTVALWFVIVVTAFGIIQKSHEYRIIFIEWQDLVKLAQDYEVEWGQLLIEKSTLASYAGLENLAKEELKMVLPARKQIVVVNGEKQ